jgi:hypothetical protein
MQLAFHGYNEWKCILISYMHAKYDMSHEIENYMQLVLSNYGKF